MQPIILQNDYEADHKHQPPKLDSVPRFPISIKTPIIPPKVPEKIKPSVFSRIFPGWSSWTQTFKNIFSRENSFRSGWEECSEYEKRTGSLGFSTFFKSRYNDQTICQDISREYSHLYFFEPYHTLSSRVCQTICLDYGFAKGECQRNGKTLFSTSCVCFQAEEPNIGNLTDLRNI